MSGSIINNQFNPSSHGKPLEMEPKEIIQSGGPKKTNTIRIEDKKTIPLDVAKRAQNGSLRATIIGQFLASKPTDFNNNNST